MIIITLIANLSYLEDFHCLRMKVHGVEYGEGTHPLFVGRVWGGGLLPPKMSICGSQNDIVYFGAFSSYSDEGDVDLQGQLIDLILVD